MQNQELFSSIPMRTWRWLGVNGAALPDGLDAAAVQVPCGPRNLERMEEDVAHVRVVMLASVQDLFFDLGTIGGASVMLDDGATDHSGLDELGACPEDGDELHGGYESGQTHPP